MQDDGSCLACDSYYAPTADLKECEPLAGNLLVQKILELEDEKKREVAEKEKYQN